MTPLLGTLAPVFGMVAAGFLARRVGALGARSTRSLVLFVFNAAIPVLLFRSMVNLVVPERIEWGFLGAFYGGAFLTYGAGIAMARGVFDRPRDEQAIYGMGAGFSNTVMLGIPILFGVLGEAATLPVFLIIAFHSVTLLPVSVVLIQSGRQDIEARAEGGSLRSTGALVRDVLANPIIAGLGLGMLANVAGLRFPGPVEVIAGAL